ncbi:unnamed protein product [Moneuplotes crassus]|uniref:USP domain-containing protein n=1 Tax=Euplotes crassus TaxID=5936 RepID=A0AAD1UM14_EUPCR|nr:unnamed protein product [Moneuplotes crassus]
MKRTLSNPLCPKILNCRRLKLKRKRTNLTKNSQTPLSSTSSSQNPHKPLKKRQLKEQAKKSEELLASVEKLVSLQVEERAIVAVQNKEEKIRMLEVTEGIKNQYLDCFMIASLQALFSVREFFEYYFEGDFGEKGSGGEGMEVSRELHQVCKKYKRARGKCISVKRFRKYFNGDFDNYKQHDACQFILHLFEKLQKEHSPETPFSQSSGHANSIEAWESYTEDLHSIIDKLFVGMSKTTFTCHSCSNSTSIYEEFKTIPLQCTSTFTFPFYETSTSEFNCSTCADITSCSITNTISHYPSYLLLPFQRLDPFISSKITKSLPFPSSFSPSPTSSLNYSLLSTINHHGFSLEGGHYTAACRRGKSGEEKWMQCDDAHVEEGETDGDEYVLLYGSRRKGG